MSSIRILVTTGLLISGCAVDGTGNGDTDPELQCRDRTVTVHHAAGYLAAHPEYVVACPGQRLIVNVVPPVAAGAARTTPADDSGADWLRSEKSGGRGRLVIEIPEAGNVEEAVYKYNITIDGVGTLDPRVRVSR